jgi:hypothetical protein
VWPQVSALQPDDYALPAAKRLRAHELGEGAWAPGGVDDGEGSGEGTSSSSSSSAAMTASEADYLDQQYARAGVVWYPDTDQQFETPQAAASVAAAEASVAASMAANVAASVAAAAHSAANDAYTLPLLPPQPHEPGPAAAWRPAKDPASGDTYFYNEQVGMDIFLIAAVPSLFDHALFQLPLSLPTFVHTNAPHGHFNAPLRRAKPPGRSTNKSSKPRRRRRRRPRLPPEPSSAFRVIRFSIVPLNFPTESIK